MNSPTLSINQTSERGARAGPQRTRRRMLAGIPLLLLLVPALLLPLLTSDGPPPSGAASPTLGEAKTGLALGVWSGQPWEPELLDSVTELLGRTPSVLLTYQSWSRRNFHASDMQEIADRGATHVVTWEPAGYTLKSIAEGDHDTFIREWARGAAEWGGTIYLRPMHEMNGDWYSWGRGVGGNTPTEFVDSWRRIHGIFADEGATNVKWVWGPNVRYGADYPLADLYPGDSYVDWVGLDGYNWGSDPHLGTPVWQTFSSIFEATYDEITTEVAPGKPIMVVETGSTENGGNKADWIRQTFLEEIPRFRDIKAVLWFNQADGPSDFRIHSSDASLAAFKEIFDSPEYQGQLPP